MSGPAKARVIGAAFPWCLVPPWRDWWLNCNVWGNGERTTAERAAMRYVEFGLLLVFLLVIPWLAYWFGQDSRNGIETDEFQRRRSRGA